MNQTELLHVNFPHLRALKPFDTAHSATPWLNDIDAKHHRKLCDSIEQAVVRSGLKDGMTISFHHAFREGDRVINNVVAKLAQMGFKNLTLASSSLMTCNDALILGLPVKTALAMASGFGWYSLSGILLTESYGPVIGSAAFFNDLARELLAIMLIPGLVRRSRSTALGLCGATSMDFTLPVLQRTGGLEMVPAAIVHGFVLSLLVPILMAFFSA